MEEVWKEAKGFEGIYEVSNLGRIARVLSSAAHGLRVRLQERRILNGGYDKDGYLKYTLYDLDGKLYNIRGHRIIALTFIPNPENKPIPHHKDHNKANNRVDNLEWTTDSENFVYALRANRRTIKHKGVYNQQKSCVRVGQYSLEGELIKVWPSIMEIGRSYGQQRLIRNVINKTNYRTAYGFIWKKVGPEVESPKIERDGKYCEPCYVFDIIPRRVMIH